MVLGADSDALRYNVDGNFASVSVATGDAGMSAA